jgi:hypothetical protein
VHLSFNVPQLDEGNLTMPVHDWTRVDAGLFHDFHLGWVCAIRSYLNNGGLPPDHYALLERDHLDKPINDAAAEPLVYSQFANRISIRHEDGDRTVARIEILPPGRKSSDREFRRFVRSASTLVRQGIHLLVVDLFPPTKRDPQGIHSSIWREFDEEDFDLPANKPLVFVSYDAGPPQACYLDTIGVGDAIPDMPVFLAPEKYIQAPLEATYQAAWSVFPAALKRLLGN